MAVERSILRTRFLKPPRAPPTPRDRVAWNERQRSLRPSLVSGLMINFLRDVPGVSPAPCRSRGAVRGMSRRVVQSDQDHARADPAARRAPHDGRPDRYLGASPPARPADADRPP